MTIIKYLILGIISAITSLLPLSQELHFFLYDKIFNTQIFTLEYYPFFSNFGLMLALIIIIFQERPHKLNKLSLKHLKKAPKLIFLFSKVFLIIMSPILIELFLKKLPITFKLTTISLIINALFLFITNQKKGSKSLRDLKFFHLLLIIPLIAFGSYLRIPYFTIIFFALSIFNFTKKDSLLLSLILMIASLLPHLLTNYSLFSLLFNSSSYLVNTISTTIVALLVYPYLKKKVLNQKLYTFSILCLLMVIFESIWFR